MHLFAMFLFSFHVSLKHSIICLRIIVHHYARKQRKKILPKNKVALKVYTQNLISLCLAGIDKLFATYKNKKTHVLHALFENISSSFLLSLNSSSHTKRIYVRTPSTFLSRHKPNCTT